MRTWENITVEATSGAGMNKRDTVSFHLYNPNGAVAQLPVYEDFCHGDKFFTGAHYVYSNCENTHAKNLRAIGNGKKATKWEIEYEVAGIIRDAAQGHKVIADKKA